jgi:hypothetical protein
MQASSSRTRTRGLSLLELGSGWRVHEIADELEVSDKSGVQLGAFSSAVRDLV